MKLLTTFAVMILSNFMTYAQDTLTPEKKARWAIKKMDESVKKGESQSLINTFNAVTDMALSRTPFLTQNELRKGKADGAKVIYINEGERSGIFRFDSNNTAVDDSSLVLVSGKRRYVRENPGYIRPEWFGASPSDEADDYEAIQKAFNTATTKGLSIVFSAGTYQTSKPLKLKNVTSTGQYNYYITISGAGEGRTTIQGLPGIKGDLLYMDSGLSGLRVSCVTIKDISLSANGANRCFWASMPGFLKFENVMFLGGEDVCCKIGTYGSNECFGIYFTRCYFNGGTLNGGQNNTLLQLHQNRMTVVDQMESDGGKFSIELMGSDKCKIINSKLEGAKRAAITIQGGYGGEHLIEGNTINPYVGGDKNGQYNGQVSGIELVGGGYNIIKGNHLFVPFSNPDAVNIFKINKVTGSLQPKDSYVLKGQTSGATGSINEYNPTEKHVNLVAKSGKFKEGEVIKQATSGASFTLDKGTKNHTYGILNATAFNIIEANHIRLNPEYGIANYAEGTIFNSNFIEAARWGIYTTGSMTITGNQISVPDHVAMERVYNNDVLASNNRIMAGSILNILTPTYNANGNLVLQNGGAFTDNGNKLQVSGNSNFNGNITVSSLPVYPDNAAASAAKLVNGALYRTPTGELRVKY